MRSKDAYLLLTKTRQDKFEDIKVRAILRETVNLVAEYVLSPFSEFKNKRLIAKTWSNVKPPIQSDNDVAFNFLQLYQ